MSIKHKINTLLQAIDSEIGVEEVLKNRKRNQVKKLSEIAVKYLEIVVKQGIAIQIDGSSGDRDNIEELGSIDQSRSRIHDSLIGQIAIVNRLCENYGLDQIYGGGDARRDKGDFAMELINDYFRNRI